MEVIEVQLKISYQYRDAGNNKKYDEIVLDNPSGISSDALFSLFRDAFIRDQQYSELTHIRPEQIGLPTLFFDEYDPELDHSLHEVLEISSTENSATIDITIDEIIYQMKMHIQQQSAMKNDINFF